MDMAIRREVHFACPVANCRSASVFKTPLEEWDAGSGLTALACPACRLQLAVCENCLCFIPHPATESARANNRRHEQFGNAAVGGAHWLHGTNLHRRDREDDVDCSTEGREERATVMCKKCGFRSLFDEIARRHLGLSDPKLAFTHDEVRAIQCAIGKADYAAALSRRCQDFERALAALAHDQRTPKADTRTVTSSPSHNGGASVRAGNVAPRRRLLADEGASPSLYESARKRPRIMLDEGCGQQESEEDNYGDGMDGLMGHDRYGDDESVRRDPRSGKRADMRGNEQSLLDDAALTRGRNSQTHVLFATSERRGNDSVVGEGEKELGGLTLAELREQLRVTTLQLELMERADTAAFDYARVTMPSLWPLYAGVSQSVFGASHLAMTQALYSSECSDGMPRAESVKVRRSFEFGCCVLH
eukprot:Opistho-2@3588